MGNPDVSIIMATWNRAHLIDRALESVRAQTFQNWELIITDDGSTDSTPEIAKKWQKKEPRIVYLRSEVNEGISKNYNKALRAARGEFSAMIDDDDAWIGADKLDRQIDFLKKNPDYVGCGGGVVVINKDGLEKYRYLKPETDEEIRNYMLYSNPIANSTSLFRTAAGEKVGWYDETSRHSGDRDFWLKMGLLGKLYNFKEYFSYYTMSEVSTSISEIKPHLKASLEIMKRYKNKYPHYAPALIINTLQYWYAFLPVTLRKLIHSSMARLKRKIVK